jgi:predicted metal-binding protein
MTCHSIFRANSLQSGNNIMTTITVCTTCRVPEKKEERDTSPCGEIFHQHMLVSAGAATGVSVRSVACLMGCERSCNVAISDGGKMTYVLGRFDGSREDADAVIEYASHHQSTETGVVPFRSWPKGVKGHFVARIPPLDADQDG